MKNVDIARDVAEGRVHGRFRVEFNKLQVTVAAAGAGVGFGTVPIGDLPTGMLFITHAKGSIKLQTTDTDISATFNGDFAIGTTPTADATVTSTDADILPLTAVGPAVARVAPAVSARRANPDTTSAITYGAAQYLDNTAGGLELNLNVLIDAADIVDATSGVFLADGWVDIMLSVQP
jgi:hypothetical protein